METTMEAFFGGPLLPVAWAAIMAFVILAYVVLDGFDLGVGMLFAVERDKAGRDVMVNTIAPLWDGNETWLVLGGSGLYGAFPIAYSVILPAFYPLIIGMILGLIFRGVAFEFRFRARTRPHRELWDDAFLGGSLVAAFCQGTILGALLRGIASTDGQFSGGVFDWLTPFPLFCGLAVVIGYSMLGATWLFWRTGGALQERMRRHAQRLGVAMIALIGIVSFWSPFLDASFFHRWFAWPGILATGLAPIAVAILAFVYFRDLAGQGRRSGDEVPFICTLGLFVVCFLGLGYSIFPLIVPPAITIWAAAAPPSSQAFLLAGTVVMIPVILAYNFFAYWIFRGKVEPGAHYH
jgi:cytochrome d ubiquinol oxidase subunit II